MSRLQPQPVDQELKVSDANIVESGPDRAPGDIVVDWDAKEEAVVRRK